MSIELVDKYSYTIFFAVKKSEFESEEHVGNILLQYGMVVVHLTEYDETLMKVAVVSRIRVEQNFYCFPFGFDQPVAVLKVVSCEIRHYTPLHEYIGYCLHWTIPLPVELLGDHNQHLPPLHVISDLLLHAAPSDRHISIQHIQVCQQPTTVSMYLELIVLSDCSYVLQEMNTLTIPTMGASLTIVLCETISVFRIIGSNLDESAEVYENKLEDEEEEDEEDEEEDAGEDQAFEQTTDEEKSTTCEHPQLSMFRKSDKLTNLVFQDRSGSKKRIRR